MALLCYNRGCGGRFDAAKNSDGKIEFIFTAYWEKYIILNNIHLYILIVHVKVVAGITGLMLKIYQLLLVWQLKEKCFITFCVYLWNWII